MMISEIFYSIQGEGMLAGVPSVFLRTSGCNLRCSWCDTPYAFHEGTKRTVEDVVDEVVQYGCPLVEVTGGEPLLQEDVYPLMEQLIARGHTVMIETGGHRSIARVPEAVLKIVDVKCPGSGESHRNHWENLGLVGPHDEVKFVIRDRADYEYARDVVARHGLTTKAGAVLFSPVHGVLEPKRLAEWVLADRLPVRVQLQLHKFIWSPTQRGV